MRYYRCKCGDRVSWGSMGPDACSRCSKCGSNLATGPEWHGPVRSHEFTAVSVETDEGPKPLTRCVFCHRTRKEIEDAGEAD